MQLSTPEILSNLPSIIFMWTCISLCWGVYVRLLYSRMIDHRERRGLFLRSKIDRCNAKFIVLANMVFFSYLLLQPYANLYIGESFIIINVFYNAYLITASARIYTWWKKRLIRNTDSRNSSVDCIAN